MDAPLTPGTLGDGVYVGRVYWIRLVGPERETSYIKSLPDTNTQLNAEGGFSIQIRDCGSWVFALKVTSIPETSPISSILLH